MVEGGRLEIVLAVLSCHVGSNPTSSALTYCSFHNNKKKKKQKKNNKRTGKYGAARSRCTHLATGE